MVSVMPQPSFTQQETEYDKDLFTCEFGTIGGGPLWRDDHGPRRRPIGRRFVEQPANVALDGGRHLAGLD